MDNDNNNNNNDTYQNHEIYSTMPIMPFDPNASLQSQPWNPFQID